MSSIRVTVVGDSVSGYLEVIDTICNGEGIGVPLLIEEMIDEAMGGMELKPDVIDQCIYVNDDVRVETFVQNGVPLVCVAMPDGMPLPPSFFSGLQKMNTDLYALCVNMAVYSGMNEIMAYVGQWVKDIRSVDKKAKIVLVGTNAIFYGGISLHLVFEKVVKKLKLVDYLEYDYYQAKLRDVRDLLVRFSLVMSKKKEKKIIEQAWQEEIRNRVAMDDTVVRPRNNFTNSMIIFESYGIVYAGRDGDCTGILHPGGVSLITLQLDPLLNRLRIVAYSQKIQKLIINQYISLDSFVLFESRNTFVRWERGGMSIGIRFKKKDDCSRFINSGNFITQISNENMHRSRTIELIHIDELIDDTCYIDCLPDEILFYIFSFMNKQDSGQASLVSSFWYTFLQDPYLQEIFKPPRPLAEHLQEQAKKLRPVVVQQNYQHIFAHPIYPVAPMIPHPMIPHPIFPVGNMIPHPIYPVDDSDSDSDWSWSDSDW